MECYTVTKGKGVRELYHLGFSGTHFQFGFTVEDWELVVAELSRFGYQVSSGVLSHGPSEQSDARCEPRGDATVEMSLDTSVCLSVPAVSFSSDEVEARREMRAYAHTRSDIFHVLTTILLRDREACRDHEMSQLFHPGTFVGEGFHGAAMELSMSLLARKFLGKFEDGTRFSAAINAMQEHYNVLFPSTENEPREYLEHSFEARVRKDGLPYLYTLGNCACLGAPPKREEDEGYYLTSHNVDTVWQQAGLLVAIASVWQMVREEIVL